MSYIQATAEISKIIQEYKATLPTEKVFVVDAGAGSRKRIHSGQNYEILIGVDISIDQLKLNKDYTFGCGSFRTGLSNSFWNM